MSAFLKNTFKIAFIAIIAGICLTGIAFSMDNAIFQNIDDYIPGNIVHFNLDTNSDDFDFGIGVSDNHNGNADNQNDAIYNNEDNDIDNNNYEYGSFSDNYQDVESIDIDISSGKVTIVEGNEFKIEATDMKEDDFESFVNNGVWEINYTGTNENNDVDINLDGDGLDINVNDSDENGNHKISIFGMDISVGSDSYVSYNDKTKFVITIPKDFEVETFNLEVDTGSVKIDNLLTKEAYINVDTGDCNIKNLTALNKSNYSVDTGNLTIQNLTAKDVTLDCGVGNINVNGVITGQSEVTCDVGNVMVNCVGNIDNYNYSVDCGIGTVIINDNKYTGVSSEYTKNNDAENGFTLECDIGKITLNIK